jgi:hypothetical protein
MAEAPASGASDMTAEQFLGVLQKRPFRPFVIHTGSGEAYAVDHPENTMISPSGRTVAVFLPGEATAIIDIISIMECVVAPSQTVQQG